MKRLRVFVGCGLLSVFASLAIAQQPANVAAAVNAADFGRLAAPGALISLFGSNLAARIEPASTMPLPNSLAGTTVEVIDGGRTLIAPLWWASPGQINGQLPYDITGSSVQIRIRSAAGVSNAVTLNVAPTAPRLFTITQDGLGRPFITHADFRLAARAAPLRPGEVVSLFMNSLGAVDPSIPAGTAAGDNGRIGPLNRAIQLPSVSINNRAARVDFAGLAPGLAGLYQVNFLMPYDNVAGDVSIRISSGAQESQAGITVPVEPNGFYWVISGSRFANGQTLNGVGGAGSAIAFRHNDVSSWGNRGLNTWTKNTGLAAPFSAMSGVALTLRSGGAIVYDNNGIETGNTGNYYDNRGGTPASDDSKPGLYLMFSMSNFLDAAFSGFFRLTERTTIDQIIGYFDGNGNSRLPFDPTNIYNRFRMNIWSNTAGSMPRDTGNFTGDVFSSDRTAGTFSFSNTGVSRFFANGATDPIFRLVYTLNTPLVLEPGEYWFSHDVAVPDITSSGSTQGRTASTYVPQPDALISVEP